MSPSGAGAGKKPADRPSHSCVRTEEAEVVEGTFASVFHVEVNLKHLLSHEWKKHKEVVEQYYIMTAEVDNKLTTEVPKSGPIPSKSQSTTRNTPGRYSTAFAIAKNENTLRIMTCAHTIEELYTADKHNVTPALANAFYRFDVHCFHQEDAIVRQAGERPLEDIERITAPAYVLALDTSRDLMVLEVSTTHIFSRKDPSGGNIVCDDDHTIIRMAQSDSGKMNKVFLQGWPPQCYMSVSTGQTCFEGRLYSSVTSLNPKGYGMKLSEIFGMVAPDGCSGGPVVNHEKQCPGVFHGVINSKGYAVSLDTVEDFLQEHRLVWLEEQTCQVIISIQSMGFLLTTYIYMFYFQLDDWSNSYADLIKVREL